MYRDCVSVKWESAEVLSLICFLDKFVVVLSVVIVSQVISLVRQLFC